MHGLLIWILFIVPTLLPTFCKQKEEVSLCGLANDLSRGIKHTAVLLAFLKQWFQNSHLRIDCVELLYAAEEEV